MKTFKTFNDAVDAQFTEDSKVCHEIIWYIERRLTFEEWVALDDAQSEAFEKVGISLDDVTGVAGPIPFPEGEEPEAGGQSEAFEKVGISLDDVIASLAGDDANEGYDIGGEG